MSPELPGSTPLAPAPPPATPPAVKREAQGHGASRESVWSLPKPLPSSWRLPFMVAMPIVLTAGWCALTLGGKPVISELFLPSPVKVLQATLQMLFEHTLGEAIAASTLR